MLNQLWLPSAVGIFAHHALALENGLARSPQMGWNNWNAFACNVSEDLLLNTAERMVHLGYRDAGYNYVILDDCWSAGRVNGVQVPIPEKFPNGIKHVSDRIHALDLKFGMYGTAGIWTCGRFPGSLGFEETDAKTFAEWGVDYLKYDNCFNAGQSGTPLITHNRYKVMSDALLNASSAFGRPILYAMCNWGEDYPWKWAQTVANSWRMSGDITDSFDREDPRCPCTGDEGYDCALPGFHCSAMNILNKVSAYTDKGIPGAWNDLDMLEVGNGGMTDTEYVTHFTMWSLVKSIMIMGYDVRKTDAATLSIYLNPAILAISQDPTGQAVHRRWRRRDANGAETQMWSGGLAYGDFVMVFLNLGPKPQKMNATLADIFVDWGGTRSDEAKSIWDLYDLWGNRMDNETASAIISSPLNGTFAGGANVTHAYYNATARPYAVGLKERDPVLLGKKTGSVGPQGTIEAEVASHGIVAYRLSLQSGPVKDEL